MQFLLSDPRLKINNNQLLAQFSAGVSSWMFAILGAADTSGKRYFEVDRLGISSTGYLQCGLYVPNPDMDSHYWARMDYRGQCYSNHGGTVSCPGYPFNAPRRLMVAYDIDAGKIWFGDNGVWVNSGQPVGGANPVYTTINGYGPVFPGVSIYGPESAQFYVSPSDWLYAPAGFSPPTAIVQGDQYPPAFLSANVACSGVHRIPLTAKRLGVNGMHSARLFDRKTGIAIREIWTDKNGNGSFDYILYQDCGYTVVEYDHPFDRSDALNAAIADLVTPEPMP